jgi:hypothetical protein
MRNSRLAIAVHEAGHAVAQLADSPSPWISSVSIDDLADGLLGYVDTAAMWQPYMATVAADDATIDMWRKLAWRDAMQYLAGPIAELRWRRYSRAGIWLAWPGFAAHCFGSPAPEPSSDMGGCARDWSGRTPLTRIPRLSGPG